MLFVGRPLTLLALAVCTYVILTWSYRTPTKAPSEKPDYLYAESGFRKYDPPSHHAPQSGKSRPEVAAPKEPVRASSSSRAAAAAAAVSKKPTLITTRPVNTYTASSDLPMATLDPEQMEDYMRDMLHWNRPGHVDGHWPDYEAFEHSEYDPNRWEGFQMYVLLMTSCVI
jgi:hypothetical protein